MAKNKFYTLRKSDLQKFIDTLAKKMTVFCPVKDGKEYNFRKIKSGDKLNIDDYSNTEFPPRQMLLPEGETILEFSRGKAEETLPSEKAAIFGVRPCDVHALIVLDRVMLEHDYTEAHYRKRKANTLIVALACREACENGFCGSMGTSEISEGFDLLFTDQGKYYHINVGSEKGQKIVNGNGIFFKPANENAVNHEIGCKKEMNTENLRDIMLAMRESWIWDDVAKRCLSCASCTFSCPTCYCFDIVHDSDISDLQKGGVKRQMDYCMLPRFSRVAGGSVFREPRAERVRQFFYHKLVYGKDNEGKFHCVGCGRCITECMAKIDITVEVKRIRDEYAKKK
jgi:hypothetical protein